jgi:DNA mismatch repair protein MutS
MTTPMMQQYREAKERHPGMLLLFRMGDFYELFFDDAEVAARMLGLTLTSRDGGKTPMAGFPHHQLEGYLRKILHAGHRAAICDQVEDPATARGLVRREVTRIVTPGTLTEDDMLDPRQANYLAALLLPGPANRGRAGLAWVDLSTGQFHAADLPGDRLLDELSRLAPSELLCPEAGREQAETLVTPLRAVMSYLMVTPRPDWTFDLQSARAALFHHFGVTTLAGFGFDDTQPCLAAAGALLLYLQETLKAGLRHLSRLRPYHQRRFLYLDDVTRRSLELTRTLRDNSRAGSLLSALDRTSTPMGARLLQEWLLAPLADRLAINRRLEAVEELLAQHTVRKQLQEALSAVADLHRLTARVSTARASPRDLAAIGRTLALLPRVKTQLGSLQAALPGELNTRLELCPDLRESLEAMLVDSPPLSPREGGVIRRGYDRELDGLHDTTENGKKWLTDLQAREITRTGINSLKVRYNQVAGYYIEVTHTHAARIPSDYKRIGTLKNAERYTTAELKELEEKIVGAQDKIYQREYDLFVQLRERTAAQVGRLVQAAEVLATLDVLAGLAELAGERGYCRPELVDELVLAIDDGRHPVLDQTLPPGTFVPNGVCLGESDGLFILLTGPNMGGKSVYIRQVALIALMAQMGSFVPAQRARIGLVDRIFTRVGASDELSRAQSTFMVEMTEAANILNNATPRSLVILDEIGRGTSTYDGVSLAWGITEYIHDTLRCRTLFATHYHELAQLASRLPQLRCYNVLVHEASDDIIFLHKIAPGSADKSYGIHVAQRAGVPEEVLTRARAVLAQLEANPVRTSEQPEGIRRPRAVQLSLFANSDDPILEELRSLDLKKLTPQQLVELVRRWKRDLRQ